MANFFLLHLQPTSTEQPALKLLSLPPSLPAQQESSLLAEPTYNAFQLSHSPVEPIDTPVSKFLTEICLPQYIPQAHQNGFELLEDLFELDDQALQSVGITLLGHRTRILRHARAQSQSQIQPSLIQQSQIPQSQIQQSQIYPSQIPHSQSQIQNQE